MTALALAVSRRLSSGDMILKPFLTLCGAGLVAWLLIATYGLDLSAGFF